MHKSTAPVIPLLLILLFIPGCELIGNLLKFGFWTGVVVVGFVVLVIWGITRAFRR